MQRQKFATAMSTAAGRAEGSRRVSATKASYIGLGPPEIQAGNRVCIFFGFSTPFVIRARAVGGYLLVGECYIYGLTDGEGLQDGNAGSDHPVLEPP